MGSRLRIDVPHGGQDRRWAVGLAVSSRCTRLEAAAINAAGRGLDTQVEVTRWLCLPIPYETTALFSSLAGGKPVNVSSLALLRAQLADLQASAVGDLLAEASIAPGRILALGVDDPGLWRFGRDVQNCYLGLCDPARLAELTGMNVVDALPARDIARGGQGGPIAALAEWVLLGDPNRNRILLDLGKTARMTYLPSKGAGNAQSRVLSFDVGPGTALLDELATRFSGGEHRFDPGGRLAVQGRRLDELVEHWMADPYFDRPLPRWQPNGVRPERFLADAMQMAVDKNWSVRDLLCTATHFIAETVAAAIRRRIPDSEAIEQMIVTGGGRQNGMLLREIGRLTGLPPTRIGEVGVDGESLSPAATAIMALLHIDQVPGNHPAITNTEVSRVLGRLTPGSPQSWQRLLSLISGTETAVRPLRSAV